MKAPSILPLLVFKEIPSQKRDGQSITYILHRTGKVSYWLCKGWEKKWQLLDIPICTWGWGWGPNQMLFETTPLTRTERRNNTFLCRACPCWDPFRKEPENIHSKDWVSIIQSCSYLKHVPKRTFKGSTIAQNLQQNKLIKHDHLSIVTILLFQFLVFSWLYTDDYKINISYNKNLS